MLVQKILVEASGRKKIRGQQAKKLNKLVKSQTQQQQSQFDNLNLPQLPEVFKSKEDVEKLAKYISITTGYQYDNIAAKLLKYRPQFIGSWLQSFSIPELSNKKQPFLMLLDTKLSDKIFSGNETLFIKIYNDSLDYYIGKLYSSDPAKDYRNNDMAIIYNPNFYKITDRDDKSNLIALDFSYLSKEENERKKLQKDLNTAVDKNIYQMILANVKEVDIKNSKNSLTSDRRVSPEKDNYLSDTKKVLSKKLNSTDVDTIMAEIKKEIED